MSRARLLPDCIVEGTKFATKVGVLPSSLNEGGRASDIYSVDQDNTEAHERLRRAYWVVLLIERCVPSHYPAIHVLSAKWP
jgi:hypothetical protein